MFQMVVRILRTKIQSGHFTDFSPLLRGELKSEIESVLQDKILDIQDNCPILRVPQASA